MNFNKPRDVDRIPRILNKLQLVWSRVPDWRLGQLIYNIARNKPSNTHDIFYFEDGDLEKELDKIINNDS
jgi:hypothetical protein